MKLRFHSIQSHRNGISGEPFHALLFQDPDEGTMLGVVFDAPQHVAVFNLSKLAAGNIAFGVNSWRGDHYEPYLRQAIAAAAADNNAAPGIDIDALLTERRQIAAIWSIEDVRERRPDLSDDQAWEVLQEVRDQFDATLGITWETLECAAEERFPAPDDVASSNNNH